MQAGDMTAAAEALQRSQDAEPDRPLTLIALGFTHNNRRRHQEAKDVLLRTLDFEPDNLEAIAALAEAEEGLGETEDARAHAQKVLARVPGHATGNLVMGLVLMKEERYAEARDAFLKAADAELVSAKPQYQLSLAYARLGDEVRAREHLENYQRRQKEIEDRVRELRGLSPVTRGGAQ
jgi:tetratricopeptide (TPR) repeat protein